MKANILINVLLAIFVVGITMPTYSLTTCNGNYNNGQCYEDGGFYEIKAVMVGKDGLWGNSYGTTVVFTLGNTKRYFINKNQKELTSLILTAFSNGKKVGVAIDPNSHGPDGSVEVIMVFTEGY